MQSSSFLKLFFVILNSVHIATPYVTQDEIPVHLNTFSGPPNENELFANATLGDSYKKFGKAAVAADAPICATIAKDILKKKGQIGDATIAGLVCMGAIHPQSSGIGGGFVAVYYRKDLKKSWTLNAREKSASSITEDTYSEAPVDGGKSIAVPGEIKGYMELYDRVGGGVPWADLFEPTAQILENGFEMDEHLHRACRVYEYKILEEKSLSEIFVNSRTGKCWKIGQTIKHPALAETLRHIGQYGGQVFYDRKDSLNKAMMTDLHNHDALITEDDFEKYEAKWTSGVSVDVAGGYKIHSAGVPASGALLAFVLRLLGSYKSSMKRDDVRSLQLTVEALKHAYGRRDRLGDPSDSRYSSDINNAVRDFTSNKEYLRKIRRKISATSTSEDLRDYQDDSRSWGTQDHGTATFSIVDELGNGISATTTINRYFGAGFRGTDTGVIFNNQMSDFSYNRETNSANIVAANKSPLSSACPLIVTDKKGNIVLNTGAAGGIKIVSVISFMAIKYLWLGYNLNDAIEAKRIHHVIDPMAILAESGFDQSLLDGLRDIGHKIDRVDRSVVVGIARTSDGSLWAATDSRKPGSVDGY